MAKKKKKKKTGQGGGSSQVKGPFNNPFAKMKGELKKTALAVEKEAAPPEKPPEPRPSARDEADIFAKAMNGVTPLDEAERSRAELGPRITRPRLDSQVEDDLEVMAQLADLVLGDAEFDLRLAGECIAGHAAGVTPQLMEKLMQGAFPIQDYLDLHGLGLDDALIQVERFLAGCATKGLRHVLIVHGRGAGSPGGVPVLKNSLAKALSHKRFQKRVLAFCTARPIDGGQGAMYLLLRHWTGPDHTWPLMDA